MAPSWEEHGSTRKEGGTLPEFLTWKWIAPMEVDGTHGPPNEPLVIHGP